jgi:hypothetical protein
VFRMAYIGQVRMENKRQIAFNHVFITTSCLC